MIKAKGRVGVGSCATRVTPEGYDWAANTEQYDGDCHDSLGLCQVSTLCVAVTHVHARADMPPLKWLAVSCLGSWEALQCACWVSAAKQGSNSAGQAVASALRPAKSVPGAATVYVLAVGAGLTDTCGEETV